MKNHFVFAVVISAVITLSAISAFSQESKDPAKDAMAPAQGTQTTAAQVPQVAPTEPAVKTIELSIYGEIQAVNSQASSMSIQYYDYDNDEEKTLELSLDKDSKLENVKTISDVKKGDWADVTYITAGGKNLAKMVSVEIEEPGAEASAPMAAAE